MMKQLITRVILYNFGVICFCRALLMIPQVSQRRVIWVNRNHAILKNELYRYKSNKLLRLSLADKNNNDDAGSTRATFDEAGKALIDEEDDKRMADLGDYDLNPDAKDDKMERMRAAIRARTADLGIEKSKVSADYIQQRQNTAISAGGARAAAEQNSQNTFAGLDLSRISDGTEVKRGSPSIWGDDDEDTPSMFFDPEDKLSEAERAEIDPFMKKGIIEQGLNELRNAKWPDWASALREVALMIFVIGITGVTIVGWDKVLRYLYTDVLHFIPSSDDIANYAARFDGLDLPKGWTDNMNEADVAKIADIVNTPTIQQQMPSSFPDL